MLKCKCCCEANNVGDPPTLPSENPKPKKNANFDPNKF